LKNNAAIRATMIRGQPLGSKNKIYNYPVVVSPKRLEDSQQAIMIGSSTIMTKDPYKIMDRNIIYPG
jgi:hypothetical protein